jgi:hypothetical protein
MEGEAMMEFESFAKIGRLSREVLITEKIDGTNGQIAIGEDGSFQVGSRTRWITPETGDNHGFLLWAMTHRDELMQLGPGRHYGEWWGRGIQRGYGLPDKRFSLFNVARWADDRDREKYPTDRPACCGVVPVIAKCLFDTEEIAECMRLLIVDGSLAAPGFMKPEGVVIFHTQSGVLFKKTLEKDEQPKGRAEA